MKNKQPKKAALYCRLSVDDGRMGESVSDYSALRKTLIHRKENIDTWQGKHQFAQGTQ